MTDESPLAKLLGIETVMQTSERTVARLVIREKHKTPTGVVHSGAILSLADNCATYMANRANDDGPNPGAFMVLVDIHSSMLGNQSGGEFIATSTVVRCGPYASGSDHDSYPRLRLALPQNSGINDAGNEGHMIKLSGVTKSFGEIDVLTGVDLELHRGDSMVLIGASGSGKSLLLKTMIGLARPDAGTVEIDGKDVRRMRSAERRAFDDRFGMLFQYGGLFDGMPVWRNIAFKQLQTGQMNERQARELAVDKLAVVNLGPEVGDLYPAELSGGMQKRVGLARAIATEPEVLFLDEPTAGLDPIMCNIIYDMILKSVRELGATSFVITSDMTGARRISNKMAMLHEGRIGWQGATSDLAEADHPEVKRFLESKSGRSGVLAA